MGTRYESPLTESVRFRAEKPLFLATQPPPIWPLVKGLTQSSCLAKNPPSQRETPHQ